MTVYKAFALVSAFVLAGCADYELGDARPQRIRIGPDMVTLCLDERINPELTGYVDFSTFPDADVDTFEREFEEVRLMRFAKESSGSIESDHTVSSNFGCRKRPPYLANRIRAGLQLRFKYDERPEGEPVLTRGMYRPKYSIFTRGDRVVFIDGYAYCPKDSACASTPAELEQLQKAMGTDDIWSVR